MAASMTSLPQEIVDAIASYLPRWQHTEIAMPSLAALPIFATISRNWQRAIERETFQEIAFRSDELSKVERMIVGHRTNMIRRLEYLLVLPTYTDEQCAEVETAADMDLNNQSFTSSVVSLLRLLRDLSDRQEDPLEHSLDFEWKGCYSPMDGYHRGYEKYKEAEHLRACYCRKDIFEERYDGSRLRLLSVDDLVDVDQIRFFGYYRDDRAVLPKSLVQIVNKFRNLESLRLGCKVDATTDSTRQEERHALASALSLIPHTQLREFRVDLSTNTPEIQDFSPQVVLLPSFPTVDHLSLSIHKFSLSEHLTQLHVGTKTVISPSLFWPTQQDTTPYWPNMEAVHVRFSMCTVDGGWFFLPDPSYDPEEHDEKSQFWAYHSDDEFSAEFPYRQHRSLADTSKLNLLFAAAAKAAAKMPKLQSMTLLADVECEDDYDFEMEFECNGSEPGFDANLPALSWTVGHSGYLPEDSTLKIWREAKDIAHDSIRVSPEK